MCTKTEKVISYPVVSAVLRHGQWRLTTDAIQRAEVFGALAAKLLVADAFSLGDAINNHYPQHTLVGLGAGDRSR